MPSTCWRALRYSENSWRCPVWRKRGEPRHRSRKAHRHANDNSFANRPRHALPQRGATACRCASLHGRLSRRLGQIDRARHWGWRRRSGRQRVCRATESALARLLAHQRAQPLELNLSPHRRLNVAQQRQQTGLTGAGHICCRALCLEIADALSLLPKLLCQRSRIVCFVCGLSRL